MRHLAQTLLILAIALINVQSLSAQTNILETASIKVKGTGTVTIPNSEARISASVTTVRDSADLSLTANSELMQSVFAALAGAGYDQDSLETSSFSLQPKHSYSSGDQVLIGYEVRNSVLVTVTETESIGPLLDLMIAAGATEINSVSFGIDNAETIKQEAIRLATADAQNKATLLAESTGVTLGPVVQITLNTSGSITAGNLGATFSPAPPIASGSNDVTASVSLTYRIIE